MELDLKNRKGKVDMYTKSEVLEFVEQQRSCGRKLNTILEKLDISRSTYYNWRKNPGPPPIKEVKRLSHTLMPTEERLILQAKKDNPHCRRRQIQGIIQNAGAYISATTVYKVLKRHGLVEPYERREAPWKKPRYEVCKRNQMWGADWTKIKINHTSWHLLTIIDFFSRFIVAHLITPEVNSSHVKAAYQRALAHQGLVEAKNKPKLRVDRGAPNTSKITTAFFVDMALDLLSLARVRRPTDNAITERFYGTLKQEEVYVVGSYPDEQTANEEIAAYIRYYNEQRPHQALWNFTPAYVHELNNKSEVLAQLEELKFNAKMRRREYWLLKRELDFRNKLYGDQNDQNGLHIKCGENVQL